MDAIYETARQGRRFSWPTRDRLLSLGIITLVFAMVAISIAGFAHISMQQQSLVVLREQSRDIQAIHQALTKADADVLYFVRGDAGRLRDYFNNLDVVRSGAETLARVDVPAADGAREAPGIPELVEELRAAWGKAIELATAGDTESAEALLVTTSGAGAVAAIGARIVATLQSADAQFPLHEDRITIGTLLVLLLQVGSGTLAILGLIHAFRSSRREAAGRVEAVFSANRSREQVARLFEMADVLQSAADHTDANAVLEATASDLVAGFPGALYVFNNSRDRLVLSSNWGQGRDTLPETINPNSCWAVKRGKPHTNRADGGKLCCDHHVAGQAVLEIPMIARGEIVGLFQLFAEGADAEARLQSVIDLGSALADGMSLALANIALREKLRNQALRDALTGLYNRRYMEDTLQRFVRIAGRENRDISLVMIDLDHFKRLNDERGHAFGDQVLRDTAVTLINNLRETDVVCRYGGEELVVLLPDCPVERAADKAEVLRQRISELSPAHGAEISASFGVACVPHTSLGVADLLAAADGALYRAKQNGRNQVVVAPLRPHAASRDDAGTADEDMPKLQAAE